MQTRRVARPLVRADAAWLVVEDERLQPPPAAPKRLVVGGHWGPSGDHCSGCRSAASAAFVDADLPTLAVHGWAALVRRLTSI